MSPYTHGGGGGGGGGGGTEENVTLHLLKLWWDWNTGENVALQLYSLFSGTLDKRSPYTQYTVEHWTKGHLTLTIQWNTGQKVTLHSLYSGTLDKRSLYTHYRVEHWTEGHLALIIWWNTGQNVS